MFYHKPMFKKNLADKDTGFTEGYKFKDVTSMDLTVETIYGSAKRIMMDTAQEDRVFYVLKGLGFARISGREYRLEEGSVLEVPAGYDVELSGQVKFISVSNKS